MKYIDADLLRKDIDNWKEAMADAVGEYSDGVRFALEHFTFVLDSLQQEQPETPSNLIDSDAVRDDFVSKVYYILNADSTNDRANQIIEAFDSLPTIEQQEQPDFPTTDEQMKEFLATHPKIKVPEKYKNPDWLLKKQEQPEVDLEEEMSKELRLHYNDDQDVYWWNYLKNSFRHFYELGKNSLK